MQITVTNYVFIHTLTHLQPTGPSREEQMPPQEAELAVNCTFFEQLFELVTFLCMF